MRGIYGSTCIQSIVYLSVLQEQFLTCMCSLSPFWDDIFVSSVWSTTIMMLLMKKAQVLISYKIWNESSFKLFWVLLRFHRSQTSSRLPLLEWSLPTSSQLCSYENASRAAQNMKEKSETNENSNAFDDGAMVREDASDDSWTSLCLPSPLHIFSGIGWQREVHGSHEQILLTYYPVQIAFSTQSNHPTLSINSLLKGNFFS